MNISGIPLTVRLTNVFAAEAMPETEREIICIAEDETTAVLRQRQIACYMLYDWNFRHADSAYLSNKYTWVQKVCKQLEGAFIDVSSLKDTLTDTLNQVLLEDVEDFIQTHMKVWKCDRLTVESEVAKAVVEIFSEQAS